MEYKFSNAIITSTDVAKRIDTIRREKGLNQEQFAFALNISQPAVSKYLRDRIPPAEILLRLARMANTTIEWILCGQKNYFFNTDLQVQDVENVYAADNDLQLAHQISSLPNEARHALKTLVDELVKYQR